jgi:hypothetical protein
MTETMFPVFDQISGTDLFRSIERNHAALSTVIARLDRATQYSRDVEINSRSRGVLDTPHARGMTIVLWGSSAA